MFTQFLSCFNVLASTARSHFPPHQTQFSSNFTVTHNSKRRVVVFVRSMASNDQKFPPQKQETQPGKEHLMDPTPQFASLEYKPANKLRGKVAVVTGGDSGIGRAVCHCFALEGATVAFTYVKGHEDKDAEDTLGMLMKAKHSDAKEPMAIPADLGYDENCKRVVEEVVNNYGRVDILVNNAAEQYKASAVEEIDEPRLEMVFRTNIFSYFFMVR
ncbi:glucose and ribitol dehydrogenase-like [Olea europaea var. sylvestris]|nr:glucose and ribitol dehydrogenase-like [Olea europaea var. sylvestris]